jgi:hypothetical protein
MIFEYDKAKGYFLSNYVFEDIGLLETLLEIMESYGTKEFYCYDTNMFKAENETDYTDVVLYNFQALYNIYFIYDTNGMVIDYDWSQGINAKILQEKV